jgi:hypothetical protein
LIPIASFFTPLLVTTCPCWITRSISPRAIIVISSNYCRAFHWVAPLSQLAFSANMAHGKAVINPGIFHHGLMSVSPVV